AALLVAHGDDFGRAVRGARLRLRDRPRRPPGQAELDGAVRLLGHGGGVREMNIDRKSNGSARRNPATRRQLTSQYDRKSVVKRTSRQPIHFRHSGTSFEGGCACRKMLSPVIAPARIGLSWPLWISSDGYPCCAGRSGAWPPGSTTSTPRAKSVTGAKRPPSNTYCRTPGPATSMTCWPPSTNSPTRSRC